ncbi:MAG: phycobilisome rod-core linker polypeptide [Trichodesmium sp. St16_bin4-tuft]|nr:phycobilisome rod-core linker polypeptide [Trichodesmium sp. MAG_R01]MDE5069063.1 phycobilisome rod-core linker polypeptide [Trichodesmium sp. St4_bin8_1]MDE5070783.1 phycobilisome rod-core linker polypeptide [Trichodesmium sp. St5_bin8]MDE5090908.1 phycobilisome rod-core linker polypeptide [Trichodesmium sp. St18_bin3_1_1]MDE5097406.1 phycobilisome rod-core linker polypeptide [Trichodesmium sp. St16_bin4-tuft]MDE5104081.1 phycobilisome rod-core linker polypeptide [Trichodesmium sp. St19_bi
MAIPLLEYRPKSQNSRVPGYVVPGDDQPIIYSAELLPSAVEWDELIWAAYRQIYSEHQILKSDRQTFLESQLKNGQITVRDFIRGLLTSPAFRRNNYETNSNYRFVELCVQRVLGRDVYNEGEKLAWSIIIATKGIEGFIDKLLDSEEYLDNFGFETVPYQRRRVIPQRSVGETPFNLKTPRYGSYYRGVLGFPKFMYQNEIFTFTPQEKKAKAGDPSLYLNLVRSLKVQEPVAKTPDLGSVNLDMVPYRKR